VAKFKNYKYIWWYGCHEVRSINQLSEEIPLPLYTT